VTPSSATVKHARAHQTSTRPRVRVGVRLVPFDFQFVNYAERLSERAVSFERHDNHCQRCGHRGVAHGFRDLPLSEQWRLLNRPRTEEERSRSVCQWPACSCRNWEPVIDLQTLLDKVGLAQVPEAWVEVPFAPGWVAAYRLVSEHGRPVLGELRLFPDEPDRPRPGWWSGEVLGSAAVVPEGGITARVLRRVRVAEYVREVGRVLDRARKEFSSKDNPFLNGVWPTSPVTSTPPGSAEDVTRPRSQVPSKRSADPSETSAAPAKANTTRRRGRPGRPDSFFARIAVEYSKANRRSWRPVADVARRLGLKRHQIRDALRKARQLGLLGSRGQGHRGGEATEKAWDLVRMRPRRHE
jgi:hypothetical protein